MTDLTQEQIIGIVKEHFPTAAPSADIVNKVKECLGKSPHSCDKNNTLYGQSVCSDEINFESGDITDLFTHLWGEVFQLGGLAGIPFTGKTGFKAYAHHIAVGGNLFVLYASHIGISKDGELGKYNRKGTAPHAAPVANLKLRRKLDTSEIPTGKADPTCGAACGALAYCLCNNPIPSPGVPFGDYQMQYIITQVNEHLPALRDLKSNAQQAHLARVIFNVAKATAELMIKENNPAPQENHNVKSESGGSCPSHTVADPLGRTVYLLGGIQINMPYPMTDYFVPLAFDKFPSNGGNSLPLLQEAFD